eukprot:TRINITY_DN74828_c0_g1_i1.p1 TRINITY_DN74828_c0_g1~~TRINITY_DN74828_c0_g1_i1.p1  ORF type:complete len:727 (+),score=153.67 TRINITY_DN74828_c0_g1_i1:98-2278(+)
MAANGLVLAGLPIFARERDHLKVYDFAPDSALKECKGGDVPLPTPKVAVWSPDGKAVGLADGNEGVQILDCNGQEATLHTVPESSKTVQGLFWSPNGSHIVTISPAVKGSKEPEPNVHVYRNGGEYPLVASFVYSKMERNKKVLQWTCDEALSGRQTPDNMELLICSGDDITAEPFFKLTFEHQVHDFAFAPLKPLEQMRLAVFCPDTRDAMAHVTKPAEVLIHERPGPLPGAGVDGEGKTVCIPVESGQLSELLWSPSGTAVLAHCMTEVDETGKSYYGGSRLMLISHDGKVQKDLTEPDCVPGHSCANGTSVQAIAWNPTCDEFVLIMGFQPAQATLWRWEEVSGSVTMVKVLLEKAHRNEIRFNPFGSLVCLAGFGNLAGQIDFFCRLEDERPWEKCSYERVSSCQAACAVNSEWAPDGLHFLTAVLAPRMRVDNAVTIWNALLGKEVCSEKFEELFDAQWRPEPPGSTRFQDHSQEALKKAVADLANKASAESAQPKKQAYRPPGARGEAGQGNSVAAMMRGELEAPEVPTVRKRSGLKAPQADDAQARTPRGGREDRSPRGSSQQQEGSAAPAAEKPKKHSQDVNKERGGSGTITVAEVAAWAASGGGYNQQSTAKTEDSHRGSGLSIRTHNHEPKQVSSNEVNGHGEKKVCPKQGWEYIDPKEKIQGPFSIEEMRQWNLAGYFRPQLRMRCFPEDAFVPFSELFPHPLIPFNSYPKRPAH